MTRFSMWGAGALAALMMAALPAPVQAQAYPNKPIKIIVPYAAGGGVDTLSRLLGLDLSDRLQTPVVIENRPGASTFIGAEMLVPTVEGTKILKIPAGVQSGTQLAMRELGVPYIGQTGRRGDQIVHVFVETPSKLSGEEKELLKKLAELRGEKLTVETEAKAKSESETQETKAEGKKHDNKKSKKKNGDKHAEDEKKDDENIFEKLVDVFRHKGE